MLLLFEDQSLQHHDGKEEDQSQMDKLVAKTVRNIICVGEKGNMLSLKRSRHAG